MLSSDGKDILFVRRSGYHLPPGNYLLLGNCPGYVYLCFNYLNAMEKKAGTAAIDECSFNLLAIQDTLHVISGKWKIPIICILRLKGKLCFNDLIREIEGISAKMLAKELREMESNDLITRTTLNTKPIMVEYRLTDYGNTLEKLIFELLNWGLTHRKRITGKDVLTTSPNDYVRKLRRELPKV